MRLCRSANYNARRADDGETSKGAESHFLCSFATLDLPSQKPLKAIWSVLRHDKPLYACRETLTVCAHDIGIVLLPVLLFVLEARGPTTSPTMTSWRSTSSSDGFGRSAGFGVGPNEPCRRAGRHCCKAVLSPMLTLTKIARTWPGAMVRVWTGHISREPGWHGCADISQMM